MSLLEKFNKSIIFVFIALQLIFSNVCYSADGCYEFDQIRANLQLEQNRTSKNYLKNKQKLDKIIEQYNIDYSTEARFEDVKRLIKEFKYNSALYELNDLILNGKNTCYAKELKAEIYQRNGRNTEAEALLKEVIKCNPNNINARFKIAKLCFLNDKNALGIDYLKSLVNLSKDENELNDIEKFIQNNAVPKDNFEANSLYELLGDIYLKGGRIEDSLGAYTTALKLNPKDIYLKYYLGDLLYKNNREDEAIRIYNSILQEYPRETQIRNAKAKSLIKIGLLLNASKEYLIILNQYPESNQAKYGIFKIYENKLPPDKILEKIHSSEQNYKPLLEDLLSFAQIIEEMNDYEAAQNIRNYAYDKYGASGKTTVPRTFSIQRPGQNISMEETTQKLSSDNSIKESKMPDKSIIEALSQVSSEASNKAIFDTNETSLEAKKEGENKNSIKPVSNKELDNKEKKLLPLFESETADAKAIDNNNKDSENVSNSANTNESEKVTITKTDNEVYEVKNLLPTLKNGVKYKKPQDLKKQEVKKEAPKSSTAKNAAVSKANTAQETEETVEETIKISEINIKKEKAKAIAKDEKKYNELNSVVEKYSQITPKTAEIYCAIANTYRQMGMQTSALKNYKEALQMQPTDSDINYDIGLTYLELNKPKSAKKYLLNSINLDKNNVKAKNLLSFVNQKLETNIINKAYTEFENKEYMNALDILDKGLKENPQSFQMYYYRALVYDKINRNAAQIMDLERSIQLNPAYYMAYYQLGHAYEKIKETRKALVAYEKFLSIEPDEKDLVEEVQKKVIDLGEKYY